MEVQIFLALASFLSLVFIMSLKHKTSNKRKLPPGPWRLPIIGNMHQLWGISPHEILAELAQKHGPLMHLQLGEVSHVVVSSPEVAEEVMKSHDITLAQRPRPLAGKIIFYNYGDIVFAPYGDYWRQLRKICTTNLLYMKRVESFRSIREEEMWNLTRSITNFVSSNVEGLPLNLSKMLPSLTSCIIERTAFGKICKKRQDTFIPLISRIVKASEGLAITDFFPSFGLLNIIRGVQHKLKSLHREVDEILESIIIDHKTRREKEKMGAQDRTQDIVDVLLDLQDQNDLELPLTTDNIKALILDLFIAGVESSSTTIEWALSELMFNPLVMEKVQTELRQNFGQQNKVEEKGIRALNYLNSVIKETLRLHPPVPLLIPRETREKVVINGYDIPAKTKVLVNARAIGRDSGHWTMPEKFLPERFLGSSIDYKGADFDIPFGAGRRICPGMLFGMATVELTLANLLYHFD